MVNAKAVLTGPDEQVDWHPPSEKCVPQGQVQGYRWSLGWNERDLCSVPARLKHEHIYGSPGNLVKTQMLIKRV